MDTYFSQAQARSLKPNTALQKTKIWRQQGKEAFSNARLKSKKRRAGVRKTSTVKAVCEGAKNFFIFSKKGLTNRVRYAIIHRLSGNPTQKASSLYRSGCGADGSALPWGGRGRWFKSSHSDQKSGIERFPIFILFYTTSPEYTYKISKNSTESENAIGAVFSALLHSFLKGVTQFAAQICVMPLFFIMLAIFLVTRRI